jgi:hypothetical protein
MALVRFRLLTNASSNVLAAVERDVCCESARWRCAVFISQRVRITALITLIYQRWIIAAARTWRSIRRHLLAFCCTFLHDSCVATRVYTSKSDYLPNQLDVPERSRADMRIEMTFPFRRDWNRLINVNVVKHDDGQYYRSRCLVDKTYVDQLVVTFSRLWRTRLVWFVTVRIVG